MKLFTLVLVLTGCTAQLTDSAPCASDLSVTSVDMGADLSVAVASDDMAALPWLATLRRIMPLGDSITAGTTQTDMGQVYWGYRPFLKDLATAAGYRIDLVGPNSNGPPGLLDRAHAGFGGWMIGDPAGFFDGGSEGGAATEFFTNIDAMIAEYQPDMLLVMLGTNDCRRGWPWPAERIGILIDRILADCDATGVRGCRVILGDIPPTTGCNVEPYNAALPGVAAARGPRVTFAKVGSNLTLDDLAADQIHPTFTTGYPKIAAAEWAALQAVQ